MTDERIVALVPVRSFRDGKNRLAGAIADTERSRLVVRMLDHVLDCLGQVGRLDCRVVSGDSEVAEHVRRRGGRIAPVAGNCLNPALDNAAAILGNGAPILAIHADLPLLAPDDIEAMLDLAGSGEVVIAADKAVQGTNAVLQPAGCPLPFLFGPGSLARFVRAAQHRGLCVNICLRPGLALDIDTPSDLAAWAGDRAPGTIPLRTYDTLRGSDLAWGVRLSEKSKAMF